MINHELETGVTESARRINDQELREFGDNAPFVCLFSGGKDSGLAISIAQDFARPMALIYYIHFILLRNFCFLT
jgi:predicted phosphoadenosine phosphosulfate sulfurtransferase